jgi:hypothetical protein
VSETKAPDLLQSEIAVTVRGEKYTFRMPSIRFEIEVGYKANDICGRSMPDGLTPSATLLGPGNRAYNFAYCCALLELYLKKATTEWPLTDGPGNVNSEKFPFGKSQVVEEIGVALGAELNRFRDDRPADGKPPGAESVAGKQDPG